MGRLGTQRERDMEGLRTQLLGQGVNIGTEAYSRAMQDFERTNTDMRTSAILGSAGRNRAAFWARHVRRASLANDARQAGFQNQLAGTNFNNANNLQSYQFAEDQRRYGDSMGLQRFGPWSERGRSPL
jgi:hypothetical protein